MPKKKNISPQAQGGQARLTRLGREKSKEKYYYDACTLDYDLGTYAEIINKKYPRDAIISHLALGEAYGNCHEKGDEIARSFAELIEKMRNYIIIVGNDDIENIFRIVRDRCSRLSLTDAVHLSTAIKHKCKVIRTQDRDLWGLTKSKIDDLCEECKIEKFSITKMPKK